MNRYNIINGLIIVRRLKNSGYTVCLPYILNLKTSKFQITTASVAHEESEGHSGREQIQASQETALITLSLIRPNFSVLQCTGVVCHPFPDWGGG